MENDDFISGIDMRVNLRDKAKGHRHEAVFELWAAQLDIALSPKEPVKADES